MRQKIYYPRVLDLSDLVCDRSCFLFGPRQSGKSSFLQRQLHEKPVLYVDLLDRADFGVFFEHFVFLELRAFLDYFEPRSEIGLWRTQKGEFEVDFVVGRRWGIEVKAAGRVTPRHLDGLRKLREEGIVAKLVVVSCEPHCRHLEEENIRIYPWRNFISELWSRRGWLWE